jgi:hypothetical protein
MPDIAKSIGIPRRFSALAFFSLTRSTLFGREDTPLLMVEPNCKSPDGMSAAGMVVPNEPDVSSKVLRATAPTPARIQETPDDCRHKHNKHGAGGSAVKSNLSLAPSGKSVVKGVLVH